MKYQDVKKMIFNELQKSEDGMTWKDLRDHLQLPYETLCPQWTKQLEQEIGLVRKRETGRAFTWRIEVRNGQA